ncbi:unnamed protein product [Dicrocoelium dendriticum]|nr:unnamed protein product [Dicrocoelium dendriticum]
MSTKCLDCCKAVSSRSKAVQCSFCEAWLHIACCNVRQYLYDPLQRTISSVVILMCDSCRTGLSVRRVSDGLPAISPCTSCLHSVQKKKDEPLLSILPLSVAVLDTSPPKQTLVFSTSSPEPSPIVRQFKERKERTYAVVAGSSVTPVPMIPETAK